MSARRHQHLTTRTRRVIGTVLRCLVSVTLLAGLSITATSPPVSSAATTTSASKAEIEPRLLDKLAASDTADFWIYFRTQADLKPASGIANRAEQGRFVYDKLNQTANSSQAGVRAMLEAARVRYQPFWIANTIKVTGGMDLLQRIAARPEVKQITADRTYHIPKPIPAQNAPAPAAVEWGLDRIRAPQAWDQFGVRGGGIVVGSIDTGVRFDHSALVGQYRGNLGGGAFDHNYNWWDPSNVCGFPSLQPCDNDGHGTHTMGTMVGDDGGGNQIGVAPDAQWMTAKGCEGLNCSQFALLSSGQFMLAPTDLQGNNPDPSKRPDVLNNSWGGDPDTDPWFQPTVQAWTAAGIFPQFANGNTPGGAACGSSSNPGNLVESYAAGAFDINNNLAPFSNRGPSAWDSGLIKPNISAPGVSIRSAWNDGSYNTISGTSMASPHVAGAVALMWSAAPALVRDVGTTRQLLDQTAIDVASLGCGGTAANNNLFGQGRLDAFAAIEQSPRGPTGTLAGTVADAGDGKPIAEARVAVSGGISRAVLTAGDGTYSTRLAVGDYTVTVSAFGYADQTAQVTVTENQATVQNFALEPVPSVTVSGQVTDGSGHGWPMYAKVSVQGTPRSTYTDPVTGRYSIALPAGSSGTFVFEPHYPGYAAASKTLDVGAGDAVLDAQLTVDDCEAAPGYHRAKVGILGDTGTAFTDFFDSRGIHFEHYTLDQDPADFDAIVVNAPGDIGADWVQELVTETDAAGTGVVWLDTWSDGGFLATGGWLLWRYTGNPATRNNGLSETNPYIYYRVTQPHPVLAGFGVGDEIVVDQTTQWKSHSWFGGYEGDGRTVIADAGRADTGDLGPGIGVQQRTNNRHTLLSLQAADFSSGPSAWTPDANQIFLNSIEWVTPDASLDCTPVEGGLVVGHVTDANTGAGVAPAAVTNVGDEADRGTTSARIADDLAHGDGFHWRFSARTGSQTFKATAHNYVDDTQTVNVTPDAVNQADFTLPAGQLDVTPTALDVQLQLGQSVQRTFTVTNTGTAPVDLQLIERRGSFDILGVNREPAPVRYVPGDFSPAAPTARKTSSSKPAGARPAADPWRSLPNYPQAVMDNSATVVDDVVYSFGGFNGTTALANAYSLDPNVGQWTAISSLPAERIKPEVIEVGGLVYILGGWDESGATHSTVFSYDPDNGSYRRVADLPGGRAAPGAAVVDGKIYVVGGCSNVFCSASSTTWRYDPAIDTWTSLAGYPQPTSWLGCAGLDRQLICTGGIDSTGNTSTSTYAYDPATDTWTRRADLPYDNWGMAYTAANGQLLVSGGVTNSSAQITNRGAAYDPTADAWSAIEPSGAVVFRGAGACGFYKIGGSFGGSAATPAVEVHPDFRDCPVTVDVPWLSVTPQTTTLAPGQQVTATVRVDGSMDQPGTYATGFSVRHDTPYTVDRVDVTATVTAPKMWGKITGTVTGTDCQGSTSPLPGAVVRINHNAGGVTRFTGTDGSYAYWLPATNNPLQLVVSGDGYVPQSRSTRIRAGETVTEDVALHRVCGTG